MGEIHRRIGIYPGTGGEKYRTIAVRVGR